MEGGGSICNFSLAASITQIQPEKNLGSGGGHVATHTETLGLRLSAPKSQRFLRFAIAMPIADPRKSQRFPKQEKAMLHCDLRVRWKVASDLRFRAAISAPKTPFFCGISGDLAPSTRKSQAIAMVRFWCAKDSGKQNPSECNEVDGYPYCQETSKRHLKRQQP